MDLDAAATGDDTGLRGEADAMASDGSELDAGGFDSGEFDSGIHPDADIPDRGSAPDATTFPDATAFPDATFPDAAPRDAGRPDAAPHDSGAPFGDGGPSFFGVVNTASDVWYDLRPPLAADTLNVTATLEFDNPGPPEWIVITSASFGLPPLTNDTFQITPSRFMVPSGPSSVHVTKIPGSAGMVGDPTFACSLGLPGILSVASNTRGDFIGILMPRCVN